MINEDIECLFAEIELNDNKVYVNVIYRSPDTDIQSFFN